MTSLLKRIQTIKFSDAFIFFLIIINILPVLAPLFMTWGWVWPAKAIYFVYSFMCHQIHWRSLHVYDHQCAWCSRDMAIWGAVLITAVLMKIFKINGLKWYQIIPFVLPIAFDGGVQTVATLFKTNSEFLYVSNNLMRTLTGAFFGIGLAGVIMPFATAFESQAISEKLSNLKKMLKLDFLKVALVTFVTVVIGYLGFVQIWDLTSTKYDPANALDFKVKLTTLNRYEISRRENGMCPVIINAKQSPNGTDWLATDCFFGGAAAN